MTMAPARHRWRRPGSPWRCPCMIEPSTTKISVSGGTRISSTLPANCAVVGAVERHRPAHALGRRNEKPRDEGHIEAHKNQARDEGAKEHVARAGGDHAELGRRHAELAGGGLVERLARCIRLVDGAGQLVGQNDQHDRRRDDLPERSRMRRWCPWPANGNSCCAAWPAGRSGPWPQRWHHDTGGGGQQRAHENDRNAKPARDRPEQLRHGHQQVFRDLGALRA